MDRYLVLGGAGLVGRQVAIQLAAMAPSSTIVIASLLESEAEEALADLRRRHPSVQWRAAWGNLFVPTDLASAPRAALQNDPSLRRRLLQALYDDFEPSYEANHLVGMIRQHRPQAIVDCVNTATGLSYQDVFTGAAKVRSWFGPEGFDPAGSIELESFLLSQSVPQLIRHVQFLHRVTTEQKVSFYLKVGTTGTGGMGMNIPYTHSEDRPSKVLLAKTEAAFGHTGLLFLLARTPDAPIVKEIKPAAMIGYRAVTRRKVKDKHGSDVLRSPIAETLGQVLQLARPAADFPVVGPLELAVVDTGENGLFTRGEFAAITALGQMEFVTPEEIAHCVVRELRGANTGTDVIGALDSSVLDPSYKAGILRTVAMQHLAEADDQGALPSVALGRLGPPELSKLLFEAQLLRECFQQFSSVLELGAGELAHRLQEHLAQSAVRTLAPSIGIPILLADGETLLRGPRINVPEVTRPEEPLPASDRAAREAWTRKGWIDLRESNMALWLQRLQAMTTARSTLRDEGSGAATLANYLPATFEIGEVVAWVFNNELGGYRIK